MGYYSPRGTSLADKLSARSRRDERGCLLWLGALNDDGYGSVFDAGKIWRVHVAAWRMKHGPVPRGLCVCHSCDVPNCFEEEHLWLGTHQENVADRDRKGRRQVPIGEANWNATLTNDRVRAIRAAIGRHSDIAAVFGVSEAQVTGIKSRKRWGHVQ